ncbi:putative oxidoreductase [Pseudoclavibacter endophyticus]|uniref:NADP-dependent oxidoreductase n=1 Tax=Pseudoclavibacter endophyticus TaxID=1778590 RepID=A0A6H9WNB1_9MICO|nr:NADP-dependent oxidoreductase [Pseudoclavibacter endophyticus]KAB1648248.1 NADP-dependent oxidoreductase [Pseudoclavibacter endophyticus]GGA70984.1 putative oxidoreductase [Pseudoclavibacter endophyticus]
MDKRWVATSQEGLDALELQDIELPPPGPGEVAIDVRAAGVNPVDLKAVGRLAADAPLPFPLGYELSGVVADLGPDAELASGGGAIGDEVLAFRVRGSHATRANVPGRDVFAKPASIPFDEAAGLLLVGTTAAEMLHRVDAATGETVLLHGASGAVGVSFLQQAARLGVRVIGTCSERGADEVRRFGGVPTPYGPGLEARVRELAPEGVAAALDAAGTDEAIEVSLALVSDRARILTIVRADAAEREGLLHIGGAKPASAAFRDSARQGLIALAAARELVVPIARAYPLADGRDAMELVSSGKAGGKVVLRP